jgi:hypothetical protein
MFVLYCYCCVSFSMTLDERAYGPLPVWFSFIPRLTELPLQSQVVLDVPILNDAPVAHADKRGQIQSRVL